MPSDLTDPTQARMFMFMPIVLTYIMAQLPVGLVIYYTWSNLISIAQQWFIMRGDAKKHGLADKGPSMLEIVSKIRKLVKADETKNP